MEVMKPKFEFPIYIIWRPKEWSIWHMSKVIDVRSDRFIESESYTFVRNSLIFMPGLASNNLVYFTLDQLEYKIISENEFNFIKLCYIQKD